MKSHFFGIRTVLAASLAALLVSIAATSTARGAEANKPLNILLFTADDQIGRAHV